MMVDAAERLRRPSLQTTRQAENDDDGIMLPSPARSSARLLDDESTLHESLLLRAAAATHDELLGDTLRGAPTSRTGCSNFKGSTAIAVCCWAYFGVLTRLALGSFSVWLAARQSAEARGFLEALGLEFFLPNVVGCFVNGAVKRLSAQSHGRHSLLWAGLSLGFCGCLTAFSAWQQAASTLLIRGNLSDALLILLLSQSLCLSSLQLGAQFGSFLGWLWREKAELTGTAADDIVGQWRRDAAYERLEHSIATIVEQGQRVQWLVHKLTLGRSSGSESNSNAIVDAQAVTALRKSVAEEASSERTRLELRHASSCLSHANRVTVLTVPVLWLLFAVVLAGATWMVTLLSFMRHDGSACVQLWGASTGLAPFGAVIRYALSLFNSHPTARRFPWGTLVSNLMGTVLLAGMLIVRKEYESGIEPLTDDSTIQTA